MYRRLTLVAAALLFATTGMTGCSKKLDCKAFVSRVKKCKKEFGSVAVDMALKEKAEDLKKMTDEQKKKLRAMVEKQAGPIADMLVQTLSSEGFLKKCKEQSGSADAKMLNDCLKKSGCKEFATCVMSKAHKQK